MVRYLSNYWPLFETGGVALGQILLRELAGKLTVAPTQTTNDLLALRVRPLDSSALEENR